MRSNCNSARGIAAWAGLALLSAGAASQPVTPQMWSTEQAAAAQDRKDELQALQTKESACAKADERDDMLLAAAPGLANPSKEDRAELLTAQLRALALESQHWRSECETALQKALDARSKRINAVKALSAKALQGIEAPLPAIAATATAAPTREEIQKLIDNAKQAQEKVDAQRRNLVGIFDEVDRATAAAFELSGEHGEKLLKQARGLQDRAQQSRFQRAHAQAAATHFVDWALELKRCDLAAFEADCAGQAAKSYGQAKAAQQLMERALKQSKQASDKVLDGALRITIGAEYPDPEDKPKRLEAYRFAKVLEDYPDAAAPFAEDSFTLLGGTTGTASLQLSLNKAQSAGWNRLSLIVSAPLADGQGELFGSADGLATSRSFTFAWQAAGLRGRLLGTQQWLWATSLEFGWGYETRSYYEDGPLSLGQQALDKTVLPWKLGASFAFHQAGGRNAHLVRIQAQRTHDLKPAEIRCPAGDNPDQLFITCVAASFGPPQRQTAAVLGYEYRLKGSNFAWSPSIAFNTHSRVTTLASPIYLVRSADDEKRPLNAGIQLSWSSKGRTSITDRTEGLWSWGVFVGAPFRLFGP